MTPARNQTSQGYIRVHIPEHPMAHAYGWVYEHRMVAYDLGWIQPGDGRHVHHKNHDRTDNRPENLEVLSHVAHAREHRTTDRPRALALYAAGLSTIAVAADLGTFPGNLSRILAEEGVPARKVDRRLKLDDDLVERMVLFGIPVKKIAEHFGCSCLVIHRIKAERRLPSRPVGRPAAGTPSIAQFMAGAS